MEILFSKWNTHKNFTKEKIHKYNEWTSEADLGPLQHLRWSFVIIVNGFQPLTIITKCSILDVAEVLDPPLNIVTIFPTLCIHINYIICKSITVYLKLEVWFWLKLSLWIMLVTFCVVDTSSVFVFNRKLTFAKDDLTLNEFFISKNVSVKTMWILKLEVAWIVSAL